MIDVESSVHIDLKQHCGSSLDDRATTSVIWSLSK